MKEKETLLKVGETYFTSAPGGRGSHYEWVLEGFSESGENAFLRGIGLGSMTISVEKFESIVFPLVTDGIEKI
jgi:hypothetical protein